jgi:small-conductance mechanosensitive channel
LQYYYRITEKFKKTDDILTTLRLEIIETIVLIVAIIGVKLATTKAIKRILTSLEFDLQRKRISQKIVNLFILLVGGIVLAAIWNIDRKELFVFFTSVLTIIGIAFFAQWSILSNITASLILFFNHPLRIGQFIQVFDKDYTVEGKLEDISFFFMHVRTKENQIVTIPNNLVLQRTILMKTETSKEDATTEL